MSESKLDYFEIFESYLRNEKRASDNTVTSYLRDIHQLEDYLFAETSHDLGSATPQDLELYIESLRNSGKSVASVSRNIASIKCMYMNLCIKEILSKNPSLKLLPEPAKKKDPEILSPEELDAILQQPKLVDLKGYRDKAILEVLAATGLKASELIDLNLNDVEEESLTCRGKKKDRSIPLAEDAKKALGIYLRLIRPQMVLDAEEQALFVNVSGERMTRQGFWKLIKHYAESAGIQKDITPHMFRNSFGSRLIQNGTDLRTIKEMMGHSDIASTMNYTSVMKKQIEKKKT